MFRLLNNNNNFHKTTISLCSNITVNNQINRSFITSSLSPSPSPSPSFLFSSPLLSSSSSIITTSYLFSNCDSNEYTKRNFAFRKRESKKELNKKGRKNDDNNKDRGAKRQPKERPKLQSMKVSRNLDSQELMIEKKMNELEETMRESRKQSSTRSKSKTNSSPSSSTTSQPRRGRVRISFDFLNEPKEEEEQQQQQQTLPPQKTNHIDKNEVIINRISNSSSLSSKSKLKSKEIDKDNNKSSTVKKIKFKKEGDEEEDEKEEEKIRLILENRKKMESLVYTEDGKYVALKVVADLDDMRLDRWVSNHYPVVTHSLLCKWIRNQSISVSDTLDTASLPSDRMQFQPSDRVKTGQWVFVPVKAAKEQRLADQEEPQKYVRLSDEEIKEIKSSVLYKDDHLIVINKPQGLSVQGGTGLKKHLDMMLSHLKFDLEESPRLCHRLDRETSGILILARTRKAASAMAEKFEMKLKRRTQRQDRDKETSKNKSSSNSDNSLDSELKQDNSIRKTYWALLTSTPNPKEGRIRAPLKKVVQDGEEIVIATTETGDGAKLAITEYQVLESSLTNASFVSLWPETGRTHQLRVHCASILNSPIVGDKKYGKDESNTFKSVLGKKIPLHLHARRVEFYHPFETKKKIDIVAPLPKTMTQSWNLLGFTLQDE